jgi:predicted DNA-binding transcriptional regulator YafY
MDAVAAQLTPAQREAAEHAAQQVLEQVRAALHGYLGLPAWSAREQTEDVLPIVETALANKQDVVLTYWGAGREQETVRRVTPYYLETRAGVLYLVAYCHLREAERVFRVDRIIECQIVG